MHHCLQSFQRLFSHRSTPRRPFSRRVMLEDLEDRRVLTAPPLSGLMVTSPINENATTTLTGLIVDPDAGQTHTLRIDWGDGTVDMVNFPANSFDINQMHQY